MKKSSGNQCAPEVGQHFSAIVVRSSTSRQYFTLMVLRGHFAQAVTSMLVMTLLAVFQDISVAGEWNVRNATELRGAMMNANGGDTILCAGGNYGSLTVEDISKSSRVTIRAASRANPPVFTANPAISLRRLRNFTFDGMKFDLTAHTETSSGRTWPRNQSTALQFYKLDDVTFRNCHFDYFGMAVFSSPSGWDDQTGLISTNIVFEYNLFTRRARDGILINRPIHGLTIRNNLFQDDAIDFARAAESDRHPDCVQFAVNGTATGCRDVLIENNKFVLGDGYSQCIFLRNTRIDQGETTADSVYHHNITVRGNDLQAPHPHGISGSGIKNFRIIGNRIRSAPPNNFSANPRVYIGHFVDGVIQNNTAPDDPGIWGIGGSLANMAQSGNNWNTENAVPSGWVNPVVGPYAYESTDNQVPVAISQSVTTPENTARAIALQATDADGDPLVYVIVSIPSHGTLSGSGAGRTYTPVANYHGNDSFAFRVTDGTANSNTALVSIMV